MLIQAMSNALSGLNVSSKRLNQSAHNLANVSTTAYTPSRTDQATLAQGGAQVVGTTATGSGGFQFTGHSLDLAINGGGFFAFSDPQYGQVYSRAGNFTINSQGNVVDQSGRALLPPVTLPAGVSQLSVSPQGRIQAMDTQGNVLAQMQIQTASFPNTGGLEAVGNNSYTATMASGPALFNAPGSGGGTIMAGALQTSGTDIAHEMVEQIISQRGFEANLKTMETADEMLGYILDIKA